MVRTFKPELEEDHETTPAAAQAPFAREVIGASGELAMGRIRDEGEAAGEPSSKQRMALKRQFEHAKSVEAKTKLIVKRFGVRPEAIDAKTAPDVMRLYTQSSAAWDAAGLDRLWAVLERLPYEHLAGIETVSRFGADRTTGMMEQSTLAVGFKSGADATTVGENDRALAPMLSDWYRQKVPADESSMRDVNKLEKTLTHEIGHNVARQLGAETGYCATVDGGGWDVMRDEDALAVGLGKLGLSEHLSAAQVHDVAHWFYVSARYWDAGDFGIPRAVRWWGTVSGEAQAAVRRMFDFIDSMMGGVPRWMQGDEAQVLHGGRVYQFDAGAGGFMSYDATARPKRVSNYQMKGPGEWFAEAYATYYAPDPRGVGALLGARDPATKKWFDENVAKKK